MVRCSVTARSSRSWPTFGGSMTSAAWKPRYRLARYAASLSLLMLWNASANARSLEAVIERGALTLCASPNALPFASKTGPLPGFQIELGEKIAEQLGVKLTREWVISAIQYRRADCDLVLDVIARKDTPPARGAERFTGVVAGKSRFRSAGRSTGRLADFHDARQGRRRDVSVRVRGRYCCCVSQPRDRGRRRHTDDGRLVQPAARRQAAAPDSGVRQRPGSELEYCGRAASPRRQAAAACRCGDRGVAGRRHHRADLRPLRHRTATSAVRRGIGGLLR